MGAAPLAQRLRYRAGARCSTGVSLQHGRLARLTRAQRHRASNVARASRASHPCPTTSCLQRSTGVSPVPNDVAPSAVTRASSSVPPTLAGRWLASALQRVPRQSSRHPTQKRSRAPLLRGRVTVSALVAVRMAVAEPRSARARMPVLRPAGGLSVARASCPCPGVWHFHSVETVPRWPARARTAVLRRAPARSRTAGRRNAHARHSSAAPRGRRWPERG